MRHSEDDAEHAPSRPSRTYPHGSSVLYYTVARLHDHVLRQSRTKTATPFTLALFMGCLLLLQSPWCVRWRHLRMAWSGSAAGCRPGGCEPWPLRAQQQTGASGACDPQLQPPVANMRRIKEHSRYVTKARTMHLTGNQKQSHLLTEP